MYKKCFSLVMLLLLLLFTKLKEAFEKTPFILFSENRFFETKQEMGERRCNEMRVSFLCDTRFFGYVFGKARKFLCLGHNLMI